MTDFYFKAKDLAVGYDGKALIEDIDISLNRGDILTLIGPNGSGKSTILKSISRQLKIISGDVALAGDSYDSLGISDMAKKMSVVLTDRIKPELMTCRDVVAMGRYPYTGRMGILTPEDEAIVTQAMEMTNIMDLTERDFSRTSDGQKQRVLLARAICQEPQIMILDEPTSFLDIKYKFELLDILRRLAKEKNTLIIMSLHEIALAKKITDYVMCIKGDRIYDYGVPEDVFTKQKIMALYDIDEDVFDAYYSDTDY